jgi:hypothetical protein
MAVRKTNNAGCPCCPGSTCHDGQLCLKVFGCSGDSGFAVEVRETVSGTVVSTYSSTVPNPAPGAGWVDCTALLGDTAYTITVTKDRYTTYVYAFHSPCRAIAWTIKISLPLTPAAGYCCPCFGIGCTEPAKLPFTMNDGLGDVVLGPGGIGDPCGVQGACELRTARNGSDNCCRVELDPYGIPLVTPLTTVSTPVQFGFQFGPNGQDCSLSALAPHDCRAITGPPDPYTGTSPTTRVLAEGSCDVDPSCLTYGPGFGPPLPCPCGGGYGTTFGPGIPCGQLHATGPPTVLSCSPLMIEQTFTVTGCMTDIYGSSLTLTVTEAP